MGQIEDIRAELSRLSEELQGMGVPHGFVIDGPEVYHEGWTDGRSERIRALWLLMKGCDVADGRPLDINPN